MPKIYVIRTVASGGFQSVYLMLLPNGGATLVRERALATRFEEHTVHVALESIRRTLTRDTFRVVRLRRMDPVQRTKERQAFRILEVLERWCGIRSGRGFQVIMTPDGIRATLISGLDRRTMGGESVSDALGQVGQSAACELDL